MCGRSGVTRLMKDPQDPTCNNDTESDGHVIIIRSSNASYDTMLVINRSFANKWQRQKVCSSCHSLTVVGMVDGRMVCIAKVRFSTS